MRRDPRTAFFIVHEQTTMRTQRLFALALGYEDLNDHAALRNDSLLKLSVGVKDAMASSPTLCRLENRADRASMWRMFGEFMYAAETWDKERRIIAKAEHMDEAPTRGSS